MSQKNNAGWWLRTDAAISWMLALPGLVDPVGVATFFGVEEPTCTYLVRLWSGFVFLFGVVSWEASRNLGARATALKYVWLEKAIVALTVLVGHLEGEVPPSLMGLIMLTNLPWVPPLLYCDIARRKETRRDGRAPGLAR